VNRVDIFAQHVIISCYALIGTCSGARIDVITASSMLASRTLRTNLLYQELNPKQFIRQDLRGFCSHSRSCDTAGLEVPDRRLGFDMSSGRACLIALAHLSPLLRTRYFFFSVKMWPKPAFVLISHSQGIDEANGCRRRPRHMLWHACPPHLTKMTLVFLSFSIVK
jgi:hypothetical protein